jgi:hypothetical protein
MAASDALRIWFWNATGSEPESAKLAVTFPRFVPASAPPRFFLYLEGSMNPHSQPKIQMIKSQEYRENYANSVQVRVSVWDFFLAFGLVHQESPDQVSIENSQGIYISPQQAKALWNILGQNIAQYEQTFGAIALEPQSHPLPIPQGPVH